VETGKTPVEEVVLVAIVIRITDESAQIADSGQERELVCRFTTCSRD